MFMRLQYISVLTNYSIFPVTLVMMEALHLKPEETL